MDRVSIVTVVYNAVDSIEQTIQSVIKQSYENIEYIVIDGNSSDGTKDIINMYVDSISIYLSEPDKGIYDAMNKGISVATGDWILFLNSGDLLYQSDILECVFNRAYLDADVIYGSTLIITLWGKYIVKPDNLDALMYKMAFCHQSVFVRLSIMKTYLFDVTYKISADYKLFNKLYVERKVFFRFDGIISIYDSVLGVSTSNAVRMYKEFAQISVCQSFYRKKVVNLVILLKLHILNLLPKKLYIAFYRLLFMLKKRYKRIG